MHHIHATIKYETTVKCRTAAQALFLKFALICVYM